MGLGFEGQILEVLKNGVHGDPKTIFSWMLMFSALRRSGLAENLSEFSEVFERQLGSFTAEDDSKMQWPIYCIL